MNFTADENSKSSDEEQNLQWLRERGVQIDIPSSRKTNQERELNHQLDRAITIVKIPCDIQEPYKEESIVINDGVPGDQLLELLKSRFVGTGKESISNSALEKAAESILQSKESNNNASILDQAPDVQKATLLNMFQNQGHVEAFPITHASATNGWKSIAFYLDEGGQLKGLPTNSRAATIAAECGYEGVALAGDVYVARRYQEGAIRHVSFSLPELDSGAEWMQTAHHDNYAHGAATGQVSMDPFVRVGSTFDKGIHASTDPKKQYEWNQDEDTVDISFKMPAEYECLTKHNLGVEISSTRLVVLRKKEVGLCDEDIVMLEINLFAEIKVGDSTWSRSGNHIEFSLEKKRESDWSQLDAL